jgi:acyl carrier protein
MTRAEILEILLNVARDVLDEEELSFNERTSFDEIESWDSSNHLRMVVRMEAALGIRFENSDLLRLKLVGDLVSVIERRQI